MFCVMYEFTVDQDQEENFKHLWHELTLKIKEDNSSLGSRLHKLTDVENTWLAYASWSSEKDYEKSPDDDRFNRLREEFLETCRGIKILYQMEVVDDLLTK
jgi:quinol monooxygenase YgiN